MVERANTFAPVKRASAAIAYFQKINLHHHLPTQSPTVGMVRQAATRKLGLTPKGRKEPFQWAQVVTFVLKYGVRNRGYYHLVVASMAEVIFGGMCRYDDVSHLCWRNVKFDPDGSCFHLSFETRKNAEFRQGNRVTVVASTSWDVCPFKLLEMLYVHTGRNEDAFVFRGFNGRLVKKSPERTSPGNACITYAQFSTFLALWFRGVPGIAPAEFQSRYGSRSGRSGGASSASNAGIPLELWGQHGDLKSAAAQRCYMQKDVPSILSVSRAAMGQRIPVPAPHGALPQLLHNSCDLPSPPTEEVACSIEGVPEGSFAWQP